MIGYFVQLYFMLLIALSGTTFFQEKTDQAKELDSIVREFYEDGRFNGVVLLARGDSIIYSGAYGNANFEWNIPHTTNSKFRIASITKTFTATLVLKLIEEGRISFDNVITDYLTDYPPETGSRITIEHLLVQSSGIPDYISLPGFLETEAYLQHDVNRFPECFKHLDLKFEPGSDWDYGNSEYYLLGLIIEKVTGMSYPDAMQTYILDPLKLDQTGFITPGAVIPGFSGGYIMNSGEIETAPTIHPSVCYSAGMMYSSANDLHRFIKALYRDNLILGEDVLKTMTTQRMADYGYGVFVGYQVINGSRHTTYLHMGELHGYTAQVSYFPENGYSVIILDNTQQCASRLYFAIMDTLPGFSSAIDSAEL
ncbi:MAG: beta-lactamase family protein [Balneolaceae bacterium]|nr:beta-lactamase family protein [Balneolaceae bacterium]